MRIEAIRPVLGAPNDHGPVVRHIARERALGLLHRRQHPQLRPYGPSAANHSRHGSARRPACAQRHRPSECPISHLSDSFSLVHPEQYNQPTPGLNVIPCGILPGSASSLFHTALPQIPASPPHSLRNRCCVRLLGLSTPPSLPARFFAPSVPSCSSHLHVRLLCLDL